MKKARFVRDCRSALPGAITVFLSCLLLAAGAISATWAEVEPPEDDSAIEASADVVVLTNVAQLVEEFSQSSLFYLPWTPWEWDLFGDGQPRWAELSEFPKEFVAPEDAKLPEMRDIKLLPLTLTRDVLTGVTVVKAGWSGQEIARIEPSAGYAPEKSGWLGVAVLQAWQEWKDHAEDWGVTEISSPTLTTRIQLADIKDKQTFDANLAAEEAAYEEEQQTLFTAEALRAQSQEDGGGEGEMLLDGGPCVITNESSPFVVLSIVPDANGMALTWQSCADHIYVVQGASELTLATSWTDMAWMWGNDGSTMWSDAESVGQTQGFYRVVRGNPNTLNDGVPYGWAVTYGLDPLDPNLALGNPLGDGFSNLEKYLLGYTPYDYLIGPPGGSVTTIRYYYDQDGRLVDSFYTTDGAQTFSLTPGHNMQQDTSLSH